MYRGLRAVAHLIGASAITFFAGAIGCNTDGSTAPPEQAAAAPTAPAVAAAAQVGTVVQASTSDIFATLGVKKPSYPEFFYDTVKDPWPADTTAACNAFSTQYPKQRACICQNCQELVHMCDALQGCTSILNCALQTGCTDATSCYYAPASGMGCAPQIDNWGTGSVSTALVVLISTCRSDNNCPTSEN